MKKLLSVLLALIILIPASAFADQADDLIATLTDADRASVKSALVLADANHREGQPYIVKIRTAEGRKEYTLTAEEYQKLVSWVDGKYKPDSSAAQSVSAKDLTNKWKLDNGYTFPIYGSTTADLSPISDYLSILAENDIILTLPELQISNKEEYEWVSSEIGDGFWLLYRPYHDGSKYSLQLQLPYTYRPIGQAFALLLVSTLSMEIDDAEAMYDKLKYNIINESCKIETDDYTVTYSEPRLSSGKLASFAVLEVTKNQDRKESNSFFGSFFGTGNH